MATKGGKEGFKSCHMKNLKKVARKGVEGCKYLEIIKELQGTGVRSVCVTSGAIGRAAGSSSR